MKKILFCVLVLLFFCCGSNKIKYDVSSNIGGINTQSHKIKNEIILKPIIEAIEDLKSEPLLDIILVRIDSMKNNKQNIYIKLSNLQTEKAFCLLNKPCRKPNGYLLKDNVLVLLYGDTESFFIKEDNNIDMLHSDKKIENIVTLEDDCKYYQYYRDTIYGDFQESIGYKGSAIWER